MANGEIKLANGEVKTKEEIVAEIAARRAARKQIMEDKIKAHNIENGVSARIVHNVVFICPKCKAENLTTMTRTVHDEVRTCSACGENIIIARVKM